MKRNLLLLLALGLLFALAGCAEEGTLCSSDADCPPDQQCYSIDDGDDDSSDGGGSRRWTLDAVRAAFLFRVSKPAWKCTGVMRRGR